MRLLALVALLAAPFLHQTPQYYQHSTTHNRIAPIHSLRGGINWHREKTWYNQDLAGVPHTKTNYAERKTRSVLYLNWLNHLWKHRLREARHLRLSRSGTPQQLIIRVFGSASPMALKVAERESGYCTCAVNGQYLGIFQMGYYERQKFATIGYETAYEQIVAAHNYYLVSGWSPWSQTAY